jgi:excisionase family DNA binding protein
MTSIADQGVDPAEAQVSRSLKVEEVAALFRVSPRTIARWADAGLLACTRTLGGVSGRGHRRFEEAEVHALLGTAGSAR